jgi:hypothetical protein
MKNHCKWLCFVQSNCCLRDGSTCQICAAACTLDVHSLLVRATYVEQLKIRCYSVVAERGDHDMAASEKIAV